MLSAFAAEPRFLGFPGLNGCPSGSICPDAHPQDVVEEDVYVLFPMVIRSV